MAPHPRAREARDRQRRSQAVLTWYDGGMHRSRSLVLALVCVAIAACGSERGLALEPVVDQWVQAEGRTADVLWVIDNSASMAPEQELLARGFAAFAKQLEGRDFDLQFAITTTHVEDRVGGRLLGRPPVLPLTTPALAVFQERATFAVRNAPRSGLEQGLEAAARALEDPRDETAAPVDFPRSDANLGVVVVSDEDDCSQPPEGFVGCAGAPLPTVKSLVDRILGWRDPSTVSVSAIVGVPQSYCEVEPGSRYLKAAARTGGLVGDLCAESWADPLAGIGLAVAGDRVEFQLSAWPDEATLVVTVNDREPSRDEYGYDAFRNALVFREPPPGGAVVAARYQRSGDPG